MVHIQQHNCNRHRGPAPILITGGEYSIQTYDVNNSTWGPWGPWIPDSAPTGNVNVKDKIRVRQSSSVAYSTTTDAVLDIGGVIGTFSVTTRDPYTVTLSAGQNGTICTAHLTSSFVLNKTPFFTVIPDPGYYTATATGCSGTLFGDTFTAAPITQPCTVSATFAANNPGNNVPTGNFALTPVPEMRISFENVTTPGTLTVTQNLNPSLPPANFSIVGGKSYDINFNGFFSGNAMVCIDYNPANITGNESNLVLLHNSTDITSPGYPDLTNHRICGATTSFSEFAVAEPLSPAPEANFRWMTDSIDSFKVNFTASGCPSGHTCTYDWDFGDGESETGGTATTSHTYADSSVMFVSLVIMDTNSGWESATTSRQVLPASRNAAPAASFDISVSGWTVTITDTSTDDAGFPVNAVRVQWGDNTSSTGNAGGVFSKSYARQGSYIIRMSITDAEGRKVYAGNAQAIVPMKFTISGKAVRLDGTTPVAGASIRLMKGTSVVKMAATKADGTYTLSDVLPDVYTVRAVKSGLTFADQPANASAGNVTNANFIANR